MRVHDAAAAAAAAAAAFDPLLSPG